MKLIAPLVSGIGGAENGHAELYRRGTSTRATWYTDFEASSSNSSGANVVLDAYGGATVYVNELVNVVVKNASGTIIREFVAGDQATAVEVMSESFTGTDYVTGLNAASKPTTLAAILDLWNDSAGTTNWQVLVNGAATDLQAAISGFSAFINIKDATYGAVGDSVTDDTAAIQAALNATGSVVIFPAGTYKVTSELTAGGKMILAPDPDSTALDVTHTGTAMSLISDALIQGLNFYRVSATADPLLDISADSAIVENCWFKGEQQGGSVKLSGSAMTVRIKDCLFSPEATVAQTAPMIDDASATRSWIYVTGCKFLTVSGALSSSCISAKWNLSCEDNYFDITATSGTYSIIARTGTEIVWFGITNNIIDVSGGTSTMLAFGTIGNQNIIQEWGNFISNATSTIYSYTLVDDGNWDGKILELGSRDMNGTYQYSLAVSGTITINSTLSSVFHVILSGVAATATITISDVPPVGQDMTLIIENTSGGSTGNITFDTAKFRGDCTTVHQITVGLYEAFTFRAARLNGVVKYTQVAAKNVPTAV